MTGLNLVKPKHEAWISELQKVFGGSEFNAKMVYAQLWKSRHNVAYRLKRLLALGLVIEKTIGRERIFTLATDPVLDLAQRLKLASPQTLLRQAREDSIRIYYRQAIMQIAPALPDDVKLYFQAIINNDTETN